MADTTNKSCETCYKEVGREFQFRRIRLKVVRAFSYCKCGGCDFYSVSHNRCLNRHFNVTGNCHSSNRPDGIGVIFVRVPYTETHDGIEKSIDMLEKIAKEYPGKTVENIIAQLKSRLEYV